MKKRKVIKKYEDFLSVRELKKALEGYEDTHMVVVALSTKGLKPNMIYVMNVIDYNPKWTDHSVEYN